MGHHLTCFSPTSNGTTRQPFSAHMGRFGRFIPHLRGDLYRISRIIPHLRANNTASRRPIRPRATGSDDASGHVITPLGEPERPPIPLPQPGRLLCASTRRRHPISPRSSPTGTGAAGGSTIRNISSKETRGLRLQPSSPRRGSI